MSDYDYGTQRQWRLTNYWAQRQWRLTDDERRDRRATIEHWLRGGWITIDEARELARGLPAYAAVPEPPQLTVRALSMEELMSR